MVLREPLLSVVVLGLTLAVTGAAALAQKASLAVQADSPGPRISPRLWGIFFEEINHAGDGGLYAEMVRNRGFEDAAGPEGWRLLRTGDGEGSIALDTGKPLNDATPHSLRLEVTRGGPGRVGVANAGYWGMAVRKGAQYGLSFHARAARGFSGRLTASLEGLGAVYAREQVGGLGTEWKRFSCTLTASDTDSAAQLVIATDKPGTVWLDVVSLFPKDTWRGRPNGLRADLARMLFDLRPSFVRFPGGCFVEGDQLEHGAFSGRESVQRLQQRLVGVAERVFREVERRRDDGQGR